MLQYWFKILDVATGREKTLQQCASHNYTISYYSYGYNVANRYVHLTSSQLNISCSM